jgi:serine phosphatase RsbU (regulator of sigma subunit)
MAAFFSFLKNNLNLIERYIFLFLLLSAVLENSSAQNVLKINSIEQANEQIENYIYLYEDTTNNLDISQILIKKEQELLLPLKQFNKKRSPKNTYWLYFSINNNLGNNIRSGLAIPRQNHIVDIYTYTDSALFTQKSGMFLDGGKNDEILPFSNIIQIKDAKRLHLYLKIKNINDELPVFSIRFINLEKAITRYTRLIIFDGLANGMMWVMIFYGLFLFFLNKDKLYLYYSLYIIFLSTWYFGCLALGYRLFHDLPRNLFPYTDIPAYIGYVFYIQFIRYFINTSQILPKWDKFFRLFQIILLIEVIVLPVFTYLTNLVLANYLISNIITVSFLGFVIIFIVRLFLLENKLATIVAIGSSFLVIGVLITSILFIILNDDKVFIFEKIGFVSELLVFTFGICFRYSLVEADKLKFQQQLIIQLSENAELHEKVNKELADKVKERTIEIEKQRDQIERINTDITDSINYAKYIQSSILPKAEKMESYLGEHFVLYKPKDIVSGDFYWISNIENKTIIAAVDCTGHGVPGAFMSMLGIALLNEIVNKEYITHPGVILRRLRKEVINSLQQKGQRGEQKDGMDIALCTLNLENMKLQFAGANNPLYLIRNSNLEKVGVLRCELSGDDRLYEIKGDLMPIGIHDKMDNFTFHEIEIFKGDSFYLFTDGFPDQFGGPDNKKFGYRQFREQLLKNNSKTMPEQKESLEKVLNEWMGVNNQIDDILVVGFRIN